ncbi:MAG: hypothetical protein JRC87_03650 [Deltaproteobacteria bacterium]|nr:hypothetical protein [Deltaproteobacteria bacterium]MBW2658682.1 hypothetical protein [Deltaproteobacteria bacterium]
MSEIVEKVDVVRAVPEQEITFYRIQFRKEGQQFTASSILFHLPPGSAVMVKTDHGPEPARVAGGAPIRGCGGKSCRSTFEISRLASSEEQQKYANLILYEERAFSICNSLIDKNKLSMQLVRVERFFNGSKIIFYFTADNRVDFRALVKNLVQEFRTRVEMRQVGVRHETKMIGGIGTCGRELCCSSFIRKFESVSIKMAKEQDLPLNPSKISGVCNRLLCCLTYEYDTYKRQRKGMPRPGKQIWIGESKFRVKRQNPLQESIQAENDDGEDVILQRDEWKTYQYVKKKAPAKEKRKK